MLWSKKGFDSYWNWHTNNLQFLKQFKISTFFYSSHYYYVSSHNLINAKHDFQITNHFNALTKRSNISIHKIIYEFYSGKKTLTLFFLTILFDFISSVRFLNILCLFQNSITALLSIILSKMFNCLIVQMHQILCAQMHSPFSIVSNIFFFSCTNSTRTTTDQLMFKALAQIYKRVCNLNGNITGKINERDVEWDLITLYQSSWLHLCVQHNSKTENWLVRQKVVTTNYIFKCPPQIFVSLLCAVMLLFVICGANVCGGWGVFAKRSCQKIETKRYEKRAKKQHTWKEKHKRLATKSTACPRRSEPKSFIICFKSMYQKCLFFLFSVIRSAKLWSALTWNIIFKSLWIRWLRAINISTVSVLFSVSFRSIERRQKKKHKRWLLYTMMANIDVCRLAIQRKQLFIAFNVEAIKHSAWLLYICNAQYYMHLYLPRIIIPSSLVRRQFGLDAKLLPNCQRNAIKITDEIHYAVVIFVTFQKAFTFRHFVFIWLIAVELSGRARIHFKSCMHINRHRKQNSIWFTILKILKILRKLHVKCFKHLKISRRSIDYSIQLIRNTDNRLKKKLGSHWRNILWHSR